MSYNAIIRAKYLRASGLFGHDRGWEVGSNASLGIGIPSRLVRKISERTNPFNIIDGKLLDDRNLVVVQNTLSGIGRYRSQFAVEADGIKNERYYLDDDNVPFDPRWLGNDWSFMFLNNKPNPSNTRIGTNGEKVYDILIRYNIKITAFTDFSSWAEASKDVIATESMFVNCTLLECNGLETWIFGQVINMKNMFKSCLQFDCNISSWNTTTVTTMSTMFYSTAFFNQNISIWNINNVIDMSGMFDGTIGLDDENRCAINTSFSSNSHWPYDWSEYCPRLIYSIKLSGTEKYLTYLDAFPSPIVLVTTLPTNTDPDLWELVPQQTPNTYKIKMDTSGILQNNNFHGRHMLWQPDNSTLLAGIVIGQPAISTTPPDPFIVNQDVWTIGQSDPLPNTFTTEISGGALLYAVSDGSGGNWPSAGLNSAWLGPQGGNPATFLPDVPVLSGLGPARCYRAVPQDHGPPGFMVPIPYPGDVDGSTWTFTRVP